MASIDIIYDDPSLYGYNSYYTAIRYTLYDSEKSYGILAYKEEQSFDTLGSGSSSGYTYKEIEITEIINKSINGGVVILLLDSTIWGISQRVHLCYKDNSSTEKSNTLTIASQELPSVNVNNITFNLSNYTYNVPIIFPRNFRYINDSDICLKIYCNGSVLADISYSPNINSSEETEILLQMQLSDNLIEQYDISSSNTKLQVTLYYYPVYKYFNKYSGATTYVNYIDFTELFLLAPTAPIFSMKNNVLKYKTVFGNDYTAPYGYDCWEIDFDSMSSITEGDGGEVVGYKLSLTNSGSEETIFGNTNPLLCSNMLFSPGTYDPMLRGLTSMNVLSEKSVSSNSINVIPYTKPIISNLTYTRLNGFEDDTLISFIVNISSLKYNDNLYNDIKIIKYRTRLSGDISYGSYQTISGTESININKTILDSKIVFECSFNLSLLKESSYDLEIAIEDKIDETSSTLFIAQGIPLLCQSEDGYVSIGRVPNFDSPCKLQTSTDILINDNGIDVPILHKLKNHVLCQDNEPEESDQLVGGLWIGKNIAEPKRYKMFESGLSKEYCDVYKIDNEAVLNYKSNYWRVICSHMTDADTGDKIYSIENLESVSMTPVTNKTRYGFNMFVSYSDKVGICKDDFKLVNGATYVLNFYAKLNTENLPDYKSCKCYGFFDKFYADPYNSINISNKTQLGIISSQWQLFEYTFTCDDVYKNSLYICFSEDDVHSNDLNVCGTSLCRLL